MRSWTVGSLLLGFCAAAVLTAQSAGPEKPAPIQAELTAPVHVRDLTPGARVLARVTVDWTGLDCALRTGSVLEAEVLEAHTRTGHSPSRLALAFNRAQCSGSDLKPMNLVLAAVSRAPESYGDMTDQEFRMQVKFMEPVGSIGVSDAGVGNFSMTHMEFNGYLHRFPMNKLVYPGDVLNIKDLKLDAGSGPDGSSLLAASKRDVNLPIYTQFLLVPRALLPGSSGSASAPIGVAKGAPSMAADPPAASGAGDPPSPQPAQPAPALPADDLAECAPPVCAVDLPVTPNELHGPMTSSIATAPLGYTPRSHRGLEEFSDEESLAWLGPQQLLFAFNPHPLIDRTSPSGPLPTQRVIRAVLFDTRNFAPQRAVEWQITDGHRYLWPLDGNRVLVHVGNELRVYGPGLEVQRTISLAGPLSFIRIAPNGELMVISTLRERHSAELHQELRENSGHDPEEDVDVLILGKEFNTLAHASSVSGLHPPTLLNEGQVNLIARPHQRYELTLSSWTGKSGDKAAILAQFTSTCTPQLASTAPDLLFLLTCRPVSSTTEYRVLRADGKQLLRGEANSIEVGHDLKGNHGSDLIAFRVVRAQHELSSQFTEADLASEEVRIYSSGGKRLLAVRTDNPVASHDSFALSPDGSRLAVLSESEIRFFAVPVR